MTHAPSATHAKEPLLSRELRKRLFVSGGIGLAILALALAWAYFLYAGRQVSIDTAVVSAPLISLAPTAPGRLNALYAQEGDTLPANAPVALVGTQVVKTKTAGLIVKVDDVLGAQIAAGTPVVTMVDPTALRVIGKIDENKGLSQIRVGDAATFTVDAFGSQTYQGVVDEVSPTSAQADVVFDISDQRPTNQFDVYVRFDSSAHPELKNGMSARIWEHTL